MNFLDRLPHPDADPPMYAARRSRSWARLFRLPPAVVALAIAAAMGPNATAAVAADDHAATCDCGMKCHPTACCCGPKRSSRRAENETAPAPPSTVEKTTEAACGPSGPCMCATPRGGDVAPVKTATVEGCDAAWIGFGPRRAPAGADRIPPPSSDRAAAADAPQIDRPPRSVPSA